MTIKKEIYRSGPLKDFFAQGVKVGDTLYLAGQVGMDEKGTPGSDIVEQARLAYANIQAVLSKFDATMDNIVDEMMYVTDVAEVKENLDGVFGARATAYGKIPEVSNTLVGVTALVMPELKIEIKCIAKL